jgi:hypothetical protein
MHVCDVTAEVLVYSNVHECGGVVIYPPMTQTNLFATKALNYFA